MKLAAGLATIEDFETGEYHEQYRIVYETKTKSRHLEAIKWFAKSPHKKVLIVPDRAYKNAGVLRCAMSERMGYFVQPDDCYITAAQRSGRVYLEKTMRE
ncbi:MAG: hypothetical protein IKY46_07880 [Clostridia bacterium]|nr:hypothetical protein [Clostridia bacterium]MBR5903832.1 hypothetical protein [Clostridia bacterium]